jgi:hypothetical protein
MITIKNDTLIIFNNYDEIDEIISRLSDELGIEIIELKKYVNCG